MQEKLWLRKFGSVDSAGDQSYPKLCRATTFEELPTYWIVVSMVLGKACLRARRSTLLPKAHGFHNSSAFVSFRCSRVHDRCLRHHFLRAGLLIRGRTCQSMGRGRSQSGEAPSGLRPTEGDLDATLNLSSRILNKSSSSFQHAVTSLPWTRVEETPMGRQIKSNLLRPLRFHDLCAMPRCKP